MKWILIISLFFNVLLGIGYYRESSKPPLERIVVETHQAPTTPEVTEKKVLVKDAATSAAVSKTAPSEKSTEKPFVEFDDVAVEQIVEKVNNDREQFLQEELALAPENLKKIEKIKKKYYQEADVLMKNMRYGADPTIEQRRQLIELEEAREFEFAEALGPEKWQKFKAYREDYNRKNMKRQETDHGVFIPMEL